MLRWASLPLVFVLAGCAGPAPPPVGPEAMPSAPPLTGAQCESWSVVDVQAWTAGDRVGPFERADIRGDIGSPPAGTFGSPAWAGATGNWHDLTRCRDSEGSQWHVAWIGVKIVRPDFDPGGPADQYVVSAVFSDAPAWVTALRARAGDLVAPLAVASAGGPRAAFTVDYAMDWMGRFQAGGVVAPFSAKESATTRLWLLLPATGGGHDAWTAAGAYRPLAIDLTDVAAPDSGRAAGPGYFRHWEPGQEDVPVTQHTGNGQAVAADGFARSVRLGPSPLVVLDRPYTHEL